MKREWGECLFNLYLYLPKFRFMELSNKKSKDYSKLIVILSISINLLIALAYLLPTAYLPEKYDLSFIPKLNAILNGCTFVSLVLALVCAKQKKISLHRNFIFAAFTFTGAFLVSYLAYHFTHSSTSYGGEGIAKIFYLIILLTHIVLAALIVPLALIAMARGINMQVEKHRKIVKWVMPIWLYVSFTGVLIYILISPYY